MLKTRGLLGRMVGAVVALSATGAYAGGGDVAEAPFAWTGFYVSAGIGYSFGSPKLGVDTGGTTASNEVNLRGEHGAPAVTVGYDFQFARRWVAGIFADYALGSTGLEGPVAVAIDNQWAIGARFGVLATPSTLLYASAGYTGADFAASQGVPSIANTAVGGFFVGFGGEQALNRNLSFKVDYRFSDYEDVEGAFTNSIVTFEDNTVHSLRLGLSWKFH